MKHAIVRFFHEEAGTELVEWGLIAGLVIVAGAAAFTLIGADLSTIFGRLETQVGAAEAASAPAP